MGNRHHVSLDRRRLAVPGGGTGPVFTDGGGLGDVGADDGETGVRCITDGVMAPEETQRRYRSLGSWQPILLA